MTRGQCRERLRRALCSSTSAIWTFTTLLFVASFLLWLAFERHLAAVHAPLHLLWPLFAIGFAVGHLASIRLEFHGQNHTIDLTDVALVPALVLAGSNPSAIVLAAALGTALYSVAIRSLPMKAAFNTAAHAIGVSAALLTFHAVLGTASALSPIGWLAALLAALASQTLIYASIRVVISLSTGQVARLDRQELVANFLSVSAANFTLGLAAVLLLWASPFGGLLFLAVAGAVGAEYASHGRLRVRHRTLSQLYHFEKALAGIVEPELVVAAVLREALGLFNAELVELVLGGGDATTCYALRIGDLEPTRRIGTHPAAALLDERNTVLLAPTGTREPLVRDALDANGLRDAIALRLPSDVAETAAVLVIANRLGGDHVTFDKEDISLAETLVTSTAMALRSGELLARLRQEIAQKEYQASHDGLTDLANRTLFSTELDLALVERHEGRYVGILLIDLDGFKSLNDTLGHEAGDAFLQVLAGLLRDVVGDRGLVGRLGGDEFAVVVYDSVSPADVLALAESLSAASRAPVALADTEVTLKASIGVSIAPLHGEDRFTLLRHSDLAMYRAKQHGGGVALHDDHHDRQIDRPSLIAALREAINTSSLEMYYQPKIRFDTGAVAGAEALIRWTHPRYGVIDPEQFIGVAETSGLIRPLTRWVLGSVVAQCSAWHRAGIEINVAVNLSPVQLDDPSIAADVRRLLEVHDLPPSALTLEITESRALAGQPDDDHHVLGPLAELGVRLSIDDFGVGTSSLARIKHLPVSEVKIDKSFITDLTSGTADDAIVASVIQLAHHLGLQVVAEGVETMATYRRLEAHGCDIAQGFLFRGALQPDDLVRWILDRAEDEQYLPLNTNVIPLRQVSGEASPRTAPLRGGRGTGTGDTMSQSPERPLLGPG
ncbi:MAG: putative bifunctional diguanylate cyclase/phosphodiesterase [Acidimicrobiales bacterium]